MIRFLIASCLCLLAPSMALSGGTSSGPEPAEQEWNFRVFLDDREIGFHNFELTVEDGTRRVTTEAEFRVRFLFFTAYRYEHENEETWEGDCLKRIESRTDDNGRRFAVRGLRQQDRFALDASNASVGLPDCIKTFAYWNPSILEESTLLNSQTGELLPVNVELVAEEVLDVRGEQMPARRYRLEAQNLELYIWYSDDLEWLALESTVDGGRKLRYELT